MTPQVVIYKRVAAEAKAKQSAKKDEAEIDDDELKAEDEPLEDNDFSEQSEDEDLMNWVLEEAIKSFDRNRKN
jgi:hypothetical protein